jgi:hypothetical protein
MYSLLERDIKSNETSDVLDAILHITQLRLEFLQLYLILPENMFCYLESALELAVNIRPDLETLKPLGDIGIALNLELETLVNLIKCNLACSKHELMDAAVFYYNSRQNYTSWCDLVSYNPTPNDMQLLGVLCTLLDRQREKMGLLFHFETFPIVKEPVYLTQ